MVVDTSAVVAILLDEPEAVALATALTSGHAPVMSAASYVEFCWSRCRGASPAEPRYDETLRDCEMQIAPLSPEQARLAVTAFARFGKGRHRPASTSATASPMRWPRSAASRCCSRAMTSPTDIVRLCDARTYASLRLTSPIAPWTRDWASLSPTLSTSSRRVARMARSAAPAADLLHGLGLLLGDPLHRERGAALHRQVVVGAHLLLEALPLGLGLGQDVGRQLLTLVQLALVLGEQALGLLVQPLRLVEVAADLVGTGIERAEDSFLRPASRPAR